MSSRRIFSRQFILPFLSLLFLRFSNLFSMNSKICGNYFLYSMISYSPFSEISRFLNNFWTLERSSICSKLIRTKFGTNFSSNLHIKLRPISIDGGIDGSLSSILIDSRRVRRTSWFISRMNAQNFKVK